MRVLLESPQNSQGTTMGNEGDHGHDQAAAGLFERRLRWAQGRGRDMLCELGFLHRPKWPAVPGASSKLEFFSTSDVGKRTMRHEVDANESTVGASHRFDDFQTAGTTRKPSSLDDGAESDISETIESEICRREQTFVLDKPIDVEYGKVSTEECQDTSSTDSIASPTAPHVIVEEAPGFLQWEGDVLDQSDEFWDLLVGPDDGSMAFIFGADARGEEKTHGDEEARDGEDQHKNSRKGQDQGKCF
ncbi:hypothetical protein CDD83_8125 [Cordyceps sp. RAO-2017]|nr:hypothetical protein CDD83_8125 [Cordyceps sp. RAO-2017]